MSNSISALGGLCSPNPPDQGLCPRLGMCQSSHSNSTTFELRTFSADSKFIEFFHLPVVEFEPQVYTIGTTCLRPPATGRTN